MGILNVTPDSFSGDGVMETENTLATALDQAGAFQAAGADIIDVGGESTRPGAEPVPATEEISRVVPIIEAVSSALPDVPISVDTSKSEVAAAAIKAGAHMINDVWGLQRDPEIAAVAAEAECPVILMHNESRAQAIDQHGSGGAHYRAGDYDHLLDEVCATLSRIADDAEQAGIAEDQIILDPGIGFGKSVTQNLALLNHLDRIKAMGYPVLVGPSRKSFIGTVLDLEVEAREEGTAAAIAVSIVRGADILRVHDVAAMGRVAKMCDAIIRAPADGRSEPAKGAA